MKVEVKEKSIMCMHVKMEDTNIEIVMNVTYGASNG